MKKTNVKKKLGFVGFAFIAALACSGLAIAASGLYPEYPILGNTQNTNSPPGPAYSTTCTSFGNNGVCNQFQPFFPFPYLQGTESFLVDSNYSSNSPVDFAVPMSLMANGFGGSTVFATTGTTALVQAADSISNLIYTGAGAATFTSFKLPPNPMNNQQFCLVNSSSGIITLSAVAAGTNTFGNTPTITGVTPTSVPVMTAVGTAGTVTLGKNCWIYQAGASNTGIWYRSL